MVPLTNRNTSGTESAQSKLLGHAMDILNCLVHSPRSLGVSEIAGRLHLAKSTSHRLLSAMVDQKLALKDGKTLRYSLNPEVFSYIHELAIHFGPLGRFSQELRRITEEMHLSVYVSMLCGGFTYVVAAAGERADSFSLGEQAPVYASSAGKVLAALHPREQWAEFAPDQSAVKLTRMTNVDPSRFYAELEDAAKRGVAWNRYESSMNAVSVAAPISEPGRSSRFAAAILLSKVQVVSAEDAELENAVRKIADRLAGC